MSTAKSPWIKPFLSGQATPVLSASNSLFHPISMVQTKGPSQSEYLALPLWQLLVVLLIVAHPNT